MPITLCASHAIYLGTLRLTQIWIAGVRVDVPVLFVLRSRAQGSDGVGVLQWLHKHY